MVLFPFLSYLVRISYLKGGLFCPKDKNKKEFENVNILACFLCGFHVMLNFFKS